MVGFYLGLGFFFLSISTAYTFLAGFGLMGPSGKTDLAMTIFSIWFLGLLGLVLCLIKADEYWKLARGVKCPNKKTEETGIATVIDG